MSRPAEAATSQPSPDLRNYIGGDWLRPGVELQHDVCDSNTGEPLMRQLGSTPVQISDAIEAAQAAHRSGIWRELGGARRAEILHAIGNELETLVNEMSTADAIMTGVPITHTRTIGRVCGAAFHAAAALAAEPAAQTTAADYIVERLPLGPAAIIGPWNAPSGIACHKLASALAAGCPVVFKPSEWAPVSGQLIAGAIDRSDLPTGVFQLLHGDGMTGAAIVGDPRIAAVSFTGGLAAGREVAASCAHQIKPAQLELGGNNPLIVLPGADIAMTVDGIIAALTTLNGQWCRALGRLMIHESLYDDVIDTVMHRLSGLRVGHSTNNLTEMGPLVHQLHRKHVEAAITAYSEKGAKILQSSQMPDLGGWFVPPTLISGVAVEDADEEVFGPVATVHRYTRIDDAVDMANHAPYGLAAYVFGERDQAYTVARRLECGMAKVNSVTLFSPHPSAPRPAWKLSGIGDEGTRETWEFFRGSKVIGVPQGLPQ